MRGVYLLVFCCLAVWLVQETDAMRGLCSRHWMTRSCYDMGDECSRMGGGCQGGHGDHGEGCACIAPNGTRLHHYHRGRGRGRGRRNGQG